MLAVELLTGKRRSMAETVPQFAHRSHGPPRLGSAKLRDDLAPELDEVVHRCSRKERHQRFASVGALAQELLRFASAPTHGSGILLEEAEAAGDEGTSERRQPLSYGSFTPLATGAGLPLRRSPSSVALAAIAVPLLVLAGWLAFRDGSFVSRSTAAGRIELPWHPRLLPPTADRSLEPRREPSSLLQVLHNARALRNRNAQRGLP